AEPIEDPPPTPEHEELAATYRAAAGALLDRIGGSRLAGVLRGITEPGPLADSIGYWPELSTERRGQPPGATDVSTRRRLATEWVKEALAELDLREKIQKEVTEDLERSQREMLLRRQMAAIRSELGDGDEDVIARYREQLEEALAEGAIHE